ncbi:DUF2065 domain-containing protein [Sinorhizobium alkalisoli]|uniref:Uncharacterized protein n=1 Tax=Sinorhizobium alkalisoli TaxID=1752398 RepID=A0A1E3V3M6_9HYPH|nr:DUF2065 domain-containing protein [Sinorhizobium alkalisoli]MCA1491704.1 DUF2065 domain-containing protein [Ensifer sp. NBAIM29]MCG5480016.1 DUF2065 family protein [Sinorhizobium alkalisoli]ODR88264.1 hypothetical protein A8M32_27350 [Sinorhizobium alkalisoli]QFI66995.1 Putative inner membrane protein YjeT (clustered with HflC) [Sinorhizobium alkalisoli]
MSDFLTGLAFFLIIEGLVYALAPLVLVEMAKRLPYVPQYQLRLAGVASVAMGVGLVWLVRG